ncbi:MAG: phage protein GemA/Gp16 family protein [Pseudomonas sp.]|uniref:phage protein GemA/Gp16 family protein n=1 Tax=Stenotrophomonas sp. TaxID=69392 RepID=UPI003D6CC305
MADDTYRELLLRVTGKSSSAAMSSQERDKVIQEMKRLGFSDARKQDGGAVFPGRPDAVDGIPMLKKVEALLAAAGRPWSYATSMAKRMFKVERLEWLKADQLHRLIAALQIHANRKSKK